jgi:methyl-accepting chemotaxis protein
MSFSDLSLGKKMSVMLAVPILGFFWFSVTSVLQTFATSTEMAKLSELTQLSIVYSDLVHELQKERGATAGFLGSKGTKFTQNLKSQRNVTNEKITKKESYWQSNPSKNTTIVTLNNLVIKSLAELYNIRTEVDQQLIKLPQALGYYTQLNAKLLSVSTLITEISSNAKITKDTVAYYSFLQGKERAGIERAVMSNTFAKDVFAPNMLARFITLMSEQKTYFNNFIAFSTKDNTNFFLSQLDNFAVKQVEALRKVALNRSATGDFGVDAEYWFTQSTKRISQLKNIESHLAKTLLVQTKKIQAEADFNLLIELIEIIVVIAVVALVVRFITKDLRMRVEELKNVMRQVREKNDLTMQVKHQGTSELGEISTSLNDTLGIFSQAIGEITASSITLAAAAEETAQTCDYNSQAMHEQQDEITMVATAVEELSATVKEVANNTQLAADSARDADGQAQNGLEVVKISYQSIESLAEEITHIAEQITSLHQSSKNITNVVDVIKSVAEQTNLLALNAAIEAARAGEQGRGFAVVADEVRTLAQRTQDSTSEIENFINTLQSDADAAYNVIATSQEKAATAVAHSKSVEQSLGEITQSISHIFSVTEQVAAAVEEQSVVTQDVAQNVVRIEEKSMASTTAATQIAVTAKEQAMLSIKLQDIAGKFMV